MILVAGASGLVGRAAVEVLQSGRRPRIELSLRARPGGAEEESRRVVACDVLDEAALLDAAPQARAIVHLAGVPPGTRPSRADHEVAAMRALLALARVRGVERFIFLSASGASPRASHPWLRAKGEAEKLLRESGVPFVILRAGLVVSAEAPALCALMQVVRSGERLRRPLLRAGRILPIAAGDVAIALACALDHHRMAGETIELGAPPALSLDDLLRLVAQRLRTKLSLSRVPFLGRALADALARVPDRPLTDADGLVALFAVLEPPSVAAYDRLLPMRRSVFVEELRSFPWGAPAPRPGEPLPVAPPGGLPPFIPVESGPDARALARLGRTDPYGRVEGGASAATGGEDEAGR